MEKIEQNRTTAGKKAMLEALEKSLGIVTAACKATGITRGTHYEWLNNDEDYRKAVEDIADITLDFAESQLQKRMKDGSDTAIIFYLKTKGKRRGYIERQEVEHSGSGISVNINMPDGD